DFVRYDTRAPWPGEADGLGYSLELKSIHEDLDNDLAENWRRSAQLRGSPGFIEREGQEVPHFRRGNCNNDNVVDLSDALRLLLFLFRGAGGLTCEDGCDVNGNGQLSLDDAIALLNYLFRPGGFAIPSPAPDECVPAAEGGCEQSNCLIQ
ncbi:MAG: hypothetical protein AAF517_22795, partial [Planctomycetota bacterium]